MQVLSGESFLTLVSTPSRMYVFLGGPGLTGLFSGYASRSVGVRSPSRLTALNLLLLRGAVHLTCLRVWNFLLAVACRYGHGLCSHCLIDDSSWQRSWVLYMSSALTSAAHVS